MKTIKSLLAASLLAALAIGCSTTHDKENMLSAAGFKMVPANTPARQAHLNSLPNDRITPVQRNGVTYYTFADRKNNVLYVGQEPQYQEYQRLRLKQQMAQEQLAAAQMNQEDEWGVWGAWGAGPGWAWR
jgi:hypothetical protein